MFYQIGTWGTHIPGSHKICQPIGRRALFGNTMWHHVHLGSDCGTNYYQLYYKLYWKDETKEKGRELPNSKEITNAKNKHHLHFAWIQR